MNATCLVDFFNIGLSRQASPPSIPTIRDGFELLISHCHQLHPAIRSLTIRIYGSWDSEHIEHNYRNAVKKSLDPISRYYKRSRIIFQIADSLVASPHFILKDTLKLRPAYTLQLQVNPVRTNCTISDCELPKLMKWSKGHCSHPSCSTKLDECVGVINQKMVDTQIVVDSITLVNEGMTDLLLVASEDQDFIPMFVYLAQRPIPLTQLIRKREYDP